MCKKKRMTCSPGVEGGINMEELIRLSIVSAMSKAFETSHLVADDLSGSQWCNLASMRINIPSIEELRVW
jgi:hypothetical protein